MTQYRVTYKHTVVTGDETDLLLTSHTTTITIATTATTRTMATMTPATIPPTPEPPPPLGDDVEPVCV